MATLNVSVTKEDTHAIISLKGNLDAETAPKFASKINELVQSGTPVIICNMKELEYIASAGLGVIISANEALKKKNGSVILTEMSDKVLKIFKMLGFDTLFTIEKDNQSALGNI